VSLTFYRTTGIVKIVKSWKYSGIGIRLGLGRQGMQEESLGNYPLGGPKQKLGITLRWIFGAQAVAIVHG